MSPSGAPAPRLFDGRRQGWFWVEDAVLDAFTGQAEKQIDDKGLAAYVLLCRRANGKAVAFPPRKEFEEKFGWSESTTKRALRQLINAGLVRRVERYRDEGDHGQLPNDYVVLDATSQVTGEPPGGQERPPRGPEETPPGASADLRKEDTGNENTGKVSPKGGEPPNLAKHYTTLTVDRMREVGFDPTGYQKNNLGTGFERLVLVPEGQEPPGPEKVMAIVAKIVETAAAGYYAGPEKAARQLDAAAGRAGSKRDDRPSENGGADRRREGYEWLFGDRGGPGPAEPAEAPEPEPEPPEEGPEEPSADDGPPSPYEKPYDSFPFGDVVPGGAGARGISEEQAAAVERRLLEIRTAMEPAVYERVVYEFRGYPWMPPGAQARMLRRVEEAADAG